MKALKCDFHIHSHFSDGKHSIEEIVNLYGSQGFGVIAITDHLCEQSHLIGQVSHGLKYSLSMNSFEDYMQSIRVAAQRAKEEFGMLVIPGFEITKNSFLNSRSAHILVIGTESYIAPELSVEDILKQAKAMNALTIAAHPFHTGDFEFQTFYLWSRRHKLKSLIDAWEVNCRRTICTDVLNSGLPLIANSDFHRANHFSSWKTKLYCELDQESIFSSIRNQNLDFFLDSI